MSTCKLCGELEETLLHLWGQCPALELEQTQLMVPGGGRLKPLHCLIPNLLEHEKEKGLQTKAHTMFLKFQWTTDKVEASWDLQINN